MKKLAVLFMAVALIASCLCTPVFAGSFEATQSFIPLADACWDYSNQTQLWRGDANLIYTMDNNGKPNDRQGFLKFDLAPVKANLEKGCNVSKATVEMTLFKMDGNFNNYSTNPVAEGPKVSLYRFDDNTWTEDGTVTAEKISRTAATSNLIISKNVDDPSLTYYQVENQATNVTFELDITEYLNSEIASGETLMSMVVGRLDTFHKNATYMICSKEYSVGEYSPKLKVQYSAKELSESEVTIQNGQTIRVGEVILDSIVKNEYYSSDASDTGLKDAIAASLAAGEKDLSLQLKFDEGSKTGTNIGLYGWSSNTYYSYLDVAFKDGSENLKIRAKDAGDVDGMNADGPDAPKAANQRYYVGLYSGGGIRCMMMEKFDISSLESVIDNIASVQFVVPSYSASDNKFILGLYKVSNNWQQSTLTYNNIPKYYYSEEIDGVEAGNIQVSTEFKNTLDNAISFTTLCAIYKTDANGVKSLEKVSVAPVSGLATGSSQELFYCFTLNELSEGEAYSGKIIVVDSISGIKPVLTVNEF